MSCTWRLPVLAAVLAMVGAGCSGGGAEDSGPTRRTVVVDRGTTEVVDLRAATVQAAPGDLVVLRSASPGSGIPDDESPVQHLFTSASAAALPPLFVGSGGGFVPNGGVWGICRGGKAADASTGCPIPPIEGPRRYDGTSYFSLGSMVPGEDRELPLAGDLHPGTYRFTCAVHPQLTVDVDVVRRPRRPRSVQQVDAAAVRTAADRAARAAATGAEPGTAVVLLGPVVDAPAAELLTAVPAEVRVPVGGSVVWRAPGRSPHTVELGSSSPPHLADTAAADTVPVVPRGATWDGRGEVRSGVLSTDPGVGRAEFRLRFTRAGTYRAFDRFHATVVSVVRVG